MPLLASRVGSLFVNNAAAIELRLLNIDHVDLPAEPNVADLVRASVFINLVILI